MNIDSDALLDSAVLVVVGMAVVFVGLLILMVAAILMVRFSEGNKNTGAGRETSPETVASSAAGEAGKETIAAVAVALALAMEEIRVAPSVRPGRTASMTQAGSGSGWSAAGRERLMHARGKVGHRWGRHPG